MAFTPRWEPAAANYLADLKAKAKASLDKRKANSTAKAAPAEGLYKQVNKTINLLLDNPRHPGLCTHEYSDLPHPWDAKQKVWEAYVQNNTPGAYRVFWCYGPNRGEITLIAITPHP